MLRFRPWRLLLRAALCSVLCTLSVSAQDGYSVFFSDTSAEAEPGESVTLNIELENSPDPVTGFSLGVTHDAELLTIGSIDIAAGLQSVLDVCSDSNFMSIRETGSGFTAAVLLRTNQCENGQLRPGQTHSLFDVTYNTSADGVGVAAVSITSNLGTPRVPVLFDLSGVAQAATSDENTTASISLGGGAPFIRGDGDQNGALGIPDAVLLLNFLFSGGLPAGAPTEDNCLLVYNYDGSVNAEGIESEGEIELNDAVSILLFLFSAGPRPALPYPACDVGPNAASVRMACTAFNCP